MNLNKRRENGMTEGQYICFWIGAVGLFLAGIGVASEFEVFGCFLFGALVLILSIVGYNIFGKIAKKEENEIAFLEECKKAGVTGNLDTSAKKEKARLIAQKYGYSDSDFNQIIAKTSAKKIAEEKAAKELELQSVRAKERAASNVYLQYSNYTGREKRVAMYRAFAAAAEEEARKKDRTLQYMDYNRTHNYSTVDPFVAGGAGAAAGGIVGGAVSAANAFYERAQEQAAKDAAFSNMMPGFVSTMIAANGLRQSADSYTKASEKAQAALVDSSFGSQELFNRLKIETQEVIVSETGSFEIVAKVSKASLLIFDTEKAVIDGTIRAELFQEGKSVGNVTLVLPVNGTQYDSTLHGINASAFAKQNVPNEVRYSAANLWAIEEP